MAQLTALDIKTPNLIGATQAAETVKSQRNRNALTEQILKEHPEDRAYQLKLRARQDEEYARGLERHKFKDEWDAYKYFKDISPRLTYDNYEQTKRHFEDLGVKQGVLPQLESFGEPGSADARKKFDEWKLGADGYIDQMLKKLKLSTGINKEVRAESEEERKKAEEKRKGAKETREQEKFRLQKEGKWKPGGEKEANTKQANSYVKTMNQLLKQYGGSGTTITGDASGGFTYQEGGQKAYQNMADKAKQGDMQAKKDLETYDSLKKKLLALSGEDQTADTNNALSWKNWQNK